MEQNCGADSHRDIRIAPASRYFLIGEMDRERLVSLPSAYGLRSEKLVHLQDIRNVARRGLLQ